MFLKKRERIVFVMKIWRNKIKLKKGKADGTPDFLLWKQGSQNRGT